MQNRLYFKMGNQNEGYKLLVQILFINEWIIPAIWLCLFLSSIWRIQWLVGQSHKIGRNWP